MARARFVAGPGPRPNCLVSYRLVLRPMPLSYVLSPCPVSCGPVLCRMALSYVLWPYPMTYGPVVCPVALSYVLWPCPMSYFLWPCPMSCRLVLCPILCPMALSDGPVKGSRRFDRGQRAGQGLIGHINWLWFVSWDRAPIPTTQYSQ